MKHQMLLSNMCTSCLSVMQALGEQLKLRQQVIATATIYFKRFYARFVKMHSEYQVEICVTTTTHPSVTDVEGLAKWVKCWFITCSGSIPCSHTFSKPMYMIVQYWLTCLK